MRVIAGSAKGHRLQAPIGFDTRPTADRIKESLFNMIAPDLPGCKFLDLFSGSGSIGIEAISRGAEYAVFVENNPIAIKSIQENLKHTKLEKHSIIYQNSVLQTLFQLGMKGHKFDIIFMDPPYHDNVLELTLQTIKEYHLLDQQGYIIIEHSTTCPIQNIPTFKIWKEKTYKITKMTFLTLQEEEI